VAEVGRTASSSWKRAATGDRSCVTKRNAAGGNLRSSSDRPADGRRSGSSVLAAIVTDRRRRVISAARSQTPPRPMASGRGRQAERGDGSVRGWRVGRRRGKTTPAFEKPEPTHPKCLGRRENAPGIRRSSREGSAFGSPNERGCPSSKCRWQKPVARISGR